jgi:hypothetical protein
MRPWPLVGDMQPDLVAEAKDALAFHPGHDAAPLVGRRFEFCPKAGMVQGRLFRFTTKVAPDAPCNRLPGGIWLKSGMPCTTMDAPTRLGDRASIPMRAAMSASSSADSTENCRVLRISVPLGYCDVMRVQDGTVSP